jgi:Type IV secretion-system coupling protein DNA-binding domain
MPLVHEDLSRQFHDWERRGRGWTVFPEPVRPEPPFRPFAGHFLQGPAVVDDGRRPTFLSSLVQKLAESLKGPGPDEPPPAEPEEPEPERFERDEALEIRAVLPQKENFTRDGFAAFLANLSLCRSPIAFEIVGTCRAVTIQFACDPDDGPAILRQLSAHFPEGSFLQTEGALEKAWGEGPGDEALVVEFGLAREFMHPLRVEKADPFVGLVGALADLRAGEVAVFQVLFEPARENWPENILFSVCHADGKPFFVNAPELAAAAKKMAAEPLHAAVVRIAVQTESFDRTLEIARDLGGSLAVYSNPQGNDLIPLENDDYPYEHHIEDFLKRQSRRSGMLLTTDELVGFVHFPSSAVRTPALLRETGKTKAAPAMARSDAGALLGENTHAGKTIAVRLAPEQRVRHMHLIGASGTGKSTLLFNLIRSDIENGQGVALLDPHGDLVERILTIIPPARIGDVILVDPSDEEFSIGFNILSAHTDLEKTLLASDLISVFQRLSTSWGDQMGSVLQNAILAFLESDAGGTLADMRRFLIEPAFRERFLKSVRDPDIVYYWKKGFTQLSGNKSIGSVLTRLETFLAPKPIRYMVSQTENRLDFGKIMDGGKIFLAKLPQGKMGKENSFLLGSLFVSKFQQTAMSRQDKAAANRRDFWLYLDEFHNFMTPSMAEILSGARKYRMGLILAHQDLRQLDRDRDVGSAVLANPFTRVIFRVGDADARTLESGLSFFEASDLQNLETGQAICRVEKASGDFNLTIPFPGEIPHAEGEARKRAVVEASRARYGKARAAVEAEILAKFETEEGGPVKKRSEKASPEKRPAEDLSLVPPALHSGHPKTPPFPGPNAEPIPSERVDGAEADMILPPAVLSEAAHAALRKADEPPQLASVPEEPEKPPRDLGQGGARHRIIQKRIKEAAEAAGFSAVIERQVPNSEKRFDVFLERGHTAIACEISLTTTVDHEIGNVSKCLKAGVVSIAVICLEASRLAKIKEAVIGTFAPEEAAKVQYFEPAAFIAHLDSFSMPDPRVLQEPKKRGGRTVKRTQSTVDTDERAAREEEYNRAIAEALKKKARWTSAD